MRTNRFFIKVVQGIGLTTALYTTPCYTAPKGTDLERLRSDTTRLGGDFKRILSREYGKYQDKQ